jgi:hypothetical protein
LADVEFLTGVGRIVWGHPMKPQDKTDNDGNFVLDDNGAKIKVWSFGLAIPKAQREIVNGVPNPKTDCELFTDALSAAAAGVPGNNLPNFAWKVKDGDTALDKNGKPLRDKDGYAGCMIYTISTEAFEPRVFQFVNGGWQQFSADMIKTGDFVRVKTMLRGHGANPKKKGSNPGIYINPNGVEFIAYGTAISGGGASAEEMFGGAPRPAALPPGASATPIAPANGSTAMPSPVPSPTPSPAPSPMPGGQPAALPPGSPSPSPTPMPGPTPSPAPSPTPIAPVAALAPTPLAAVPSPTPSPAPTASPTSVQPAHDFVANAMGRQPVGFDPNNGKPIYGYNGTRPIYGWDGSGQWPIYGFDANGQPVYQ